MGARVLSGSFAGQSVIVTDASGAYVIPGVGVVAGKRALILIASAGSFADTGEPAALGRTRVSSFAYGAFTLTGTASAAALVEPVGFGSFAETGGAATLLTGSPGHITAVYGAFSFTGEPAGFRETRKLSGTCGSFTVIGEPAVLTPVVSLRTLSLAAWPAGFDLDGMASFGRLGVGISVGAFSFSGGAAAFSRAMPLAGGSFTLVGELSLRRIVARMAGAPIALTGFASSAALVEPVVNFGSFALTGRPSLRRMNALLAPGFFGFYGRTSFRVFGALAFRGSFVWSVEPVRLTKGSALSARTGSYAETGEAATLRRMRDLLAGAGAISLSGQRSGITVVRLGGVPGVGAIAWAAAARPNVKWIS